MSVDNLSVTDEGVFLLFCGTWIAAEKRIRTDNLWTTLGCEIFSASFIPGDSKPEKEIVPIVEERTEVRAREDFGWV